MNTYLVCRCKNFIDFDSGSIFEVNMIRLLQNLVNIKSEQEGILS